MIGAVCYLELLHVHRRGRQRLFCWVYAGWLLAEFGLLYSIYWLSSSPPNRVLVRIEAASDFINNFIELFVVQQYILLLLVTPALVAGTITDEKTRRTLPHLLTTGLTSVEIILGKMLGQLARVLELAILGLPLLCLIGAVGGVEPGVIFAVFLSPLLPLVAVASLSLLASVWCRSTREAVLAVYLLGGLAFIAAWLTGGAVAFLDPRYVLEPAWEDANWREWGQRWLASGWLWGGLTFVCLGLAIWRLRPAYARQLMAQRRGGWYRERPAVSDLPVYWKARYVESASVPVFRSMPAQVGWVVAIVLGCLVPGPLVWTQNAGSFNLLGFLVALFAGAVVGIRCSGSVVGEREGETWEPLLLTPLEPRQLLRSKVLGSRDAIWPYVLAYGIPAVLMSFVEGLVAGLWTAFWLYAAWVIMYWMGSCGVACSMRSTSSWASLLSTLFTGYRGILGCIISAVPVGCGTVCLVNLVLLIPYVLIEAWLGDHWLVQRTLQELLFMLYFLGLYIMAGVNLIGLSEARLQEVEKHLESEERVKQRYRSPLSPEEKEERRQALGGLQFQIPSYPPNREQR
jgi:ABC-type transport system involved in multi-copper enzyme maturation permease subunit